MVEHNEEFPIESLGTQNICSRLSLSVSLLSGPLSQHLSPLSSQLALFLWPFDLSERVWSFKVLLFLLSGLSLFLPSGLGFQSGGSLVPWLGGSGGWGTGFYEVVSRRGVLVCAMLSVTVMRGPD